jgi:hypothetical protein
MALSPDGRQLALTLREPAGIGFSLWVRDLETLEMRQLPHLGSFAGVVGRWTVDHLRRLARRQCACAVVDAHSIRGRPA